MRNQPTMQPVLVVLLFLAQGLVGGQEQRDVKTATMTKVGAVLSAVYEEYRVQESQGGATDFESENPLIRITEGRVIIDAVASGDTAVPRADLEALGMQQAASFGRMVSGQLPVAAIADVDVLDSLQFARPAAAAPRGPRRPARPQL